MSEKSPNDWPANAPDTQEELRAYRREQSPLRKSRRERVRKVRMARIWARVERGLYEDEMERRIERAQ